MCAPSTLVGERKITYAAKYMYKYSTVYVYVHARTCNVHVHIHGTPHMYMYCTLYTQRVTYNKRLPTSGLFGISFVVIRFHIITKIINTVDKKVQNNYRQEIYNWKG